MKDAPQTRRHRRPTPSRTAPRRNILGVFSQSDGGGFAPPSEGHPLGLPDWDTAPTDKIAADLNRADMQAAANLIDRHIENGEKYTISTDHDAWGTLSSLANGIDASEIADLAKTLTHSYAEAASLWVEAVGKLRDMLSSRSPTTPALNGPPLFVQAAQRISAKLHMFGSGPVLRAQPLVAETGVLITDVSYDGTQLNIHVPADTAPGTYHGLLVGPDHPVGAVTLTVPEMPS